MKPTHNALMALVILLTIGCAGEVVPSSMEPSSPEQTPIRDQNPPSQPPQSNGGDNTAPELMEAPPTQDTESDCGDGSDNDANGLIDCADQACAEHIACQIDEAPQCDLNTDIAVKITANVSWEGTVGLEGGNGPLEIWYGATLTPEATGARASGRVCGASVPDFRTTEIAGGDTHGTVIPEAVWQSEGVPSADLVLQLSGLEPGASLVANPMALVIGAAMADPLNSPWPNSHRAIDAVDHDGDGYPGVTAEVAQGPGYANPRVALLNANLRASRIFLALRTIIGLDGALETCDRASGAATLFLDQRSLGCILQNGNECRPQNTDILDNNTPAFRITNATFELVRMPEGASCADITDALP